MSEFRRYLGANIGHHATLWSNQFEIRYSKQGQMLLFLQDYEIKKIRENTSNAPKPKSCGHMWIKVPKWLESTCKEVEKSSRKIAINGKVWLYNYKDSDRKNVTIRLDSVLQVKPKKTKLALA